MMCMNRGSEGVRFAGATEQGREEPLPHLPSRPFLAKTGELKTSEALHATT
jgi:hypothetical protein